MMILDMHEEGCGGSRSKGICVKDEELEGHVSMRVVGRVRDVLAE